MGDALLATCLAAGLLLLSFLLLLCLKARNRNQDGADYTIPRRPTAQPNHYQELRSQTSHSRSTAQESLPDGAVPSYENSPASATVVEEGSQPSANTGHRYPGNGVNNIPTGRQGAGSIRRQLAIEMESDVTGGGGGPESSAQDEAGPPVVPPRRVVGEHASGPGVAETQPRGVSDVTSSRDLDPDDASQSPISPPHVPPRENGRVLRRQEAISDSASAPGSSDDSADNDSTADDATEDRLPHPNGDVPSGQGYQTTGRSGGRHQGNPGRDSPAPRNRGDLETVTVMPTGEVKIEALLLAGANHTFPRSADGRGPPAVDSKGKSRTAPREGLGHLETVIVHGDSVTVLTTSHPSASGDTSASPATPHSDRNDNSDAPPPVPRRPRQEGVGVVRLRK